MLLYGLRSCVSNNADSLQLRNYFSPWDEIPTLLKHNCLDICKTALFTNRLFEGPLNILFDVSISARFVCIKALKVGVDFILHFFLSIILWYFNSLYDRVRESAIGVSSEGWMAARGRYCLGLRSEGR